MSTPKIGRIAVWVDCTCGAEVYFSDLDDGKSMVSLPCDDCGSRVEVSVDVFVQHVKVFR